MDSSISLELIRMCCRPVVLGLLGLLLMSPALQAAPKGPVPMEIAYSTPTCRVNVAGDMLIFEDRHYEYADRSPSPNPTRMALSRWRITLPSGELKKLQTMVRSTSFYKLKGSYGTQIKRYGYILRIRDSGKDKTVEYWSGPEPDAQGRPGEHKKIGDYLLDLARRLTQGVEPVARTEAKPPG